VGRRRKGPQGKLTPVASKPTLSRRGVLATAGATIVAGAVTNAHAQTGRGDAMANTRFINPPTIGKPPGYTHVVEVTGPARIVYTAGQLGIDVSGKMAQDFRGQVEQAFQNLKAALDSVGAKPEHVVKVNNYIVDIGKNIPVFREVRDKYLNMAAPPASTTIGVPELARPGALFEVEAVVMLPS
jgi:enamine deaminase RidA (YjgF/YER057c/UK114 family)